MFFLIFSNWLQSKYIYCNKHKGKFTKIFFVLNLTKFQCNKLQGGHQAIFELKTSFFCPDCGATNKEVRFYVGDEADLTSHTKTVYYQINVTVGHRSI